MNLKSNFITKNSWEKCQHIGDSKQWVLDSGNINVDWTAKDDTRALTKRFAISDITQCYFTKI